MLKNNLKSNISAREIQTVFDNISDFHALAPVVAKGLTVSIGESTNLAELASIVETDPALATHLYLAAHENNVCLESDEISVLDILNALPIETIRSIFLDVKLVADSESNENFRELRKRLYINSIAIACCSELIADSIETNITAGHAYLAALLFNIGKYAFLQEFPKSYEKIVKEATATRIGLSSVEHKYFGLDHNLVGKRIASRMHFGSDIAEAIWLAQTSSAFSGNTLEVSTLTRIVGLSHKIVSNSSYAFGYDVQNAVPVEQLAQSLNLSSSSLESIKHRLQPALEARVIATNIDGETLSLESFESLRSSIRRILEENKYLSKENSKLSLDASYNNFISMFVSSIKDSWTLQDIASEFTKRFAKEFNLSNVSLCLLNDIEDGYVNVITTKENISSTRNVAKISNASQIYNLALEGNKIFSGSEDRFELLFKEIASSVNRANAGIVCLSEKMQKIAWLIFEVSQQSPSVFDDAIGKVFEMLSKMLNLSITKERQEKLSESFVCAISKLQENQKELIERNAHLALAEMAAGAAHEFNNPLSVISGRAQILLQSETDAEKKKMLEQIQAKSNDISDMVKSILSFAKPREAIIATLSLRELIDESVKYAIRKKGISEISINLASPAELPKIAGDKDQLIEAIGNIIINAIESFDSGVGDISIELYYVALSNKAGIQISDNGCGMDSSVIANATKPFYSHKKAGRQPGLGLAIAQRLFELNNAQLSIESKPSVGTKVEILIPIA